MTRWLLLVALVVCACGPKSMKARMAASEKRSAELEELLQRAEKEMAELEPTRAQSLLDDARAVSNGPDISLHPEHEMLKDRLAADEKQLPQVKRAREKRDLDEAVAKQRAALEPRLAQWKSALAATEARNVTVRQVKDARAAEDEVREVLADGASLIERDAAYTALAKDVRAQLEKAEPALTLAMGKATFIEEVGEVKAKAAAALKLAKKAPVPDDKKDAATDALDQLKRCSERGKPQVAAVAGLGKAPVLVDGAVTTPEVVLSWCSAQVKDAQKLIADADKAIAAAAVKAKAKAKKRR